jgi:pimeloyl-ACP methyl ester carboxylesterase
VLAGHSFGGLDMILFAATHPELVDGVVLIDSSHPDQLDALAEVPEMLAAQDAEIAGLDSLATAAAAGELTADDVLANAPDLPPDQQQVWAQLFVQPASLQTAVAEYESLPASAEQVAANGSLGDVPLAVIARGLSLGEELPPEALEAFGLTPEAIEKFDTIWRGLQEDHATRSTDGTLVVADDSGHYVYRSQPELVVEQIRNLVEASGA